MSDIAFVSIFRRRQRRFACLAVLAVCLQLLVSGIGNLHVLERLAAQAPFAADICHGTANGTDDGETSEVQASGGHCPFCRLASAGAVPLAPDALSFPQPEPVAFFVPAADAGLQPSVPDSRHAPKHAPPFFLA